ncbi:MAG: DVUA0089 family protein [Treponema sp.]|nr:DVUA0089 family protein [Treponema sp.]MCL2236781.1 DVUA0089 family protein [Treponema sp.]
MKRVFLLISIFFLAASLTFAQTGAAASASPVGQMDEAVKNLANEIHAKLLEKRAEKVLVGQFTFQDGVPPFSSYWVNQLVGELTNMRGRNYIILTGGAQDAGWTIVGEIVQVADVIRVYSRLIRLSDRAIEGSFYSSFERNDHINDMISGGGGGTSSNAAAAGGRDAREPDSWDSPVTYIIGTSPTAAVMNRTITEGDEDFFLLVPERDGRLTMETTGSIDTYMHFYNYDTGDEIAVNDDGGQGLNARIVQSVRAGTRYLAVVRGFGGSTAGAYGFRAFIVVREGMSSFENPIAYEIGEGDTNIVTVNRTLQQGDEDYFLLVPARNGRLTIETTGRIDTYMELYDADREMLDENDDGGNNNNARLRYSVTAGTRYIVLIRGYSQNVSGSYGFRAFFPDGTNVSPDEFEPDNEPGQAKSIEIGATQTRNFHSGDDIDWVRFQITRAGRYTINVRGVNNNRLDTYIELYDSNLNLIAEDDDGGDSLSSRLSLNLNNGTYLLKIWCLDDEPNQPYTLSITQ